MKYIIIIIIIILLIFLYSQTTENFIGRSTFTCNPKICSDQTTIDTCLNCYECGYCMNKNGGKCVPGSPEGPYGNIKCDRWLNNDPSSVYKYWLN